MSKQSRSADGDRTIGQCLKQKCERKRKEWGVEEPNYKDIMNPPAVWFFPLTGQCSN